jgi:hypothetical protein
MEGIGQEAQDAALLKLECRDCGENALDEAAALGPLKKPTGRRPGAPPL